MPEVSILVKAKDEASKVFKDMGGSLNQLDGAFSKVGVIGPLSLLAVGAGLTKLAVDAANIEEVRRSFDNLAIDAGKDADLFLAELQKMSGGQVSEANLMMMTNKALIVSGTDVADKLPTYFAIARAASEATGESFEEMFQKLVMGIESGSTRMLRQLGLTIDVDEAHKKYAGSIGKSVDALTDLEKKTAAENAVMEAAEGQLKRLGATTVTTDDKLEIFTTHVEDLKLRLGTALIPVLGTAVDILIAFFDSIVNADKEAEDLIKTFYDSSDSADAFALKLAGLRDKTSGADSTLEQLRNTTAYYDGIALHATMTTEENAAAQDRLAAAYDAAGHEIPYLVDQTEELAEANKELAEEAAKAALAMHISQAGQILDIRDGIEAYEELRDKVISAYADTSETTHDYQVDMTRTEEDNLAKREDLLAKHAEKRAWIASGDWDRSKEEQDDAHSYWEGIMAQELIDFDADIVTKATRREEDYNDQIAGAQRAAAERAAIAEAERVAELERMRAAQTERLVLFALEMLEYKGLLQIPIEGWGDMKVSAQDYLALVQAGIIPLSDSLVINLGGALTGLQGSWDAMGTTGKTNMEGLDALVASIFPNIFDLGDTALRGIATSADTYIVQAGETLSGLATRWGVTVGEILAVNDNILDPNMIRVGETLKKPFEDADTKVGELQTKLTNLASTGETEAGRMDRAMRDQFGDALLSVETGAETLETQLGETGVAGVKAATDTELEVRQVIPALTDTQTGSEDLEIQLGEMGTVGVKAANDIELAVRELIPAIGDVRTIVVETMPKIETSIREGMEEPVEDALEELEDYREELEKLDGSGADIWIRTHYQDIHHPAKSVP